MKKILMALCAVAMLTFSACHKDEVEPTPSGNQNNPVTPTPPAQEDPLPVEVDRAGQYAPGRKMVSISIDGALSETWHWNNGGQLEYVSDSLGQEKVRFTYRDDGRINTMTVNANEALNGTVTLSYSGEKVNQITLDGLNDISAQVNSNTRNKVTSAVVDMSGMDNSTVVAMLNGVLSRFVGDSVSTDFISAIDSVKGSISFTWTGSNVSVCKTVIGARVKTTVGQLATLLNNDFSMFGALGTVLQGLATYAPNTAIYISVTLNDESEYEYDANTNPFRHYLGDMLTIENDMPRFNVSALSANNVKTEWHTGIANVRVYSSLSPYSYTDNYNLYGTGMSYTYTYRTDKYPSSVTNSEGQVTTYTYQQ